MTRYGLSLAFLLLAPVAIYAEELPPAAEKPIRFEHDVLPILEANCHDCHGEFGQEGNFRLDRKTPLLKGGDSGEPGILVGNSEKSHLIRLVAGLEPDLRMPPDEGDALSTDDIAILRAWIDQGAKWPGPNGVIEKETVTSDHWAFQPVAPVEVPNVNSQWVKNPIDQFILDRLNQEGLTPNDMANRHTLIRRLSLDVLGLPPDPSEVAAYVDTTNDDATDQLVEAMLASPHYGERWATHWLDLVRFAETYGFETNRERPNAWRYRDYVIQAFNDDMPYDQFIREQLAGDSYESPIGLGYLVAGPYDQVKSPDINLTLMQRQNELDDMINTTSTAFLGLTIGCARCHNHKFDPISQSDYYSMQAIFAGVQHGDMALPLSQEQTRRVESLQEEITRLERELSPYIRHSGSNRFVIIDDDPDVSGTKVAVLQPIAGQGINLPGKAAGQANDPGDDTRSPNVSGGRYSWWKHKPNEPVIAWRPQLAGTYRIWLSWRCGYDSHCQDAQYVIDRDGNPQTRDDWDVLAIINQQQFANGKVELKGEPLWSGLFHAAIAKLDADDQILLVGGSTGSALTADVLLLEEVGQSPMPPPARPTFREALSPVGNVEHIAAQQARFVRMTIDRTNSGSQPCLDELSIFSQGRNVALASEGGKPTASGSLSGHPIHQLKHLNDGKYSNSFSWISDTPGKGWVQIELPNVVEIDRIEWSRDRKGKYSDRLPIEYRIEVSLDGQTWKEVASHSDRLPMQSQGASNRRVYRFDHLSSADAETARQLVSKLDFAMSALETATTPTKAYAGQYKQPGPTHRLYRGEPLAKREQVLPNAPKIFTDLQLPADSPEADRRRELANWIASPANPLTARVIVNRIWQFHFGAGLVDTPSDFGAAGISPTHPELLDWLAAELVRHNWSLKHIHRLILQSATYQQSSVPNSEGLQADGGSSLLWRYPPHRLEAEPIRDSILKVSGVLDTKQGGPGFSAFEVEAENVRHYHPKKEFGPGDWRRMVYMTKVRMEKDAVFGLFDCPDAATTVAKRSRSTTPLQALNLFNSKFVLQQAELLSQRLQREATSESQRVTRAFELCYGRAPSTDEVTACQAFIEQQGLEAFCRALLNSNEFLFIQ